MIETFAGGLVGEFSWLTIALLILVTLITSAIHGATGVSQWTPLAEMYTSQRTLRFADGPDEVHWFVVGRAELARRKVDGAGEYDPKANYLSRS